MSMSFTSTKDVRRKSSQYIFVYRITQNVNLVDLTAENGSCIVLYIMLDINSPPHLKHNTEHHSQVVLDGSPNKDFNLNEIVHCILTLLLYLLKNVGNASPGVSDSQGFRALSVRNPQCQPKERKKRMGKQ